MTLSKRQISIQYGMNANMVDALIEAGYLTITPESTPLRPQILEASVASLKENQHYVVCLLCGARQGMITPRHVQACSKKELSEYMSLYPNAPIMSDFTTANKKKTETQKKKQSENLIARFQTTAGFETKRQISDAAKKMQSGPYRERAANHLRTLNAQPEQKAARQKESLARWEHGDIRKTIQQWVENHPQEVLDSAAHARSHITKHYTKLHDSVKQALLSVGLTSVTEFKVGYYSIDEAFPQIKLAIEVDGCYWHGCTVCGYVGVPNIKRTDARKSSYLKNHGWTVIRLPEHEVKADMSGCIRKIQQNVQTLDVLYDS